MNYLGEYSQSVYQISRLQLYLTSNRHGTRKSLTPTRGAVDQLLLATTESATRTRPAAYPTPLLQPDSLQKFENCMPCRILTSYDRSSFSTRCPSA